MNLKEITQNFENFFSWDKKEIKENKSDIDELMDKLLEKRDKLEKN